MTHTGVSRDEYTIIKQTTVDRKLPTLRRTSCFYPNSTFMSPRH
jgi:hypothetical protein